MDSDRSLVGFENAKSCCDLPSPPRLLHVRCRELTRRGRRGLIEQLLVLQVQRTGLWLVFPSDFGGRPSWLPMRTTWPSLLDEGMDWAR